MKLDFWRGRRVFVTGHTGFKGSWLSLWLEHLSAKVTGFSLPAPTQPSLFEMAGIARGMTSIFGDIRDLPALVRAMQAAQPEVVVHLAAQPLVRRSYQDPVETYFTNVMGTVHLLEAVRHCPSVRAVINVTSDKCYENKEWIWPYRESDPIGGYDPYSSSKGCAELLTSAYRNSFFNADQNGRHFVALASARSGNVFGGGDFASDRLVPDALTAFAQGRPVVIRSPEAVRPWQHVLEPLSGYLRLAQLLFEQGAPYAEAFNFGPRVEDAKPVQWIVERLAALWGDGARWELDNGIHPHEAGTLRLDSSKATQRLNWQPRLSLDEALDLTVSWSVAHMSGRDVREISLQQIGYFADRL